MDREVKLIIWDLDDTLWDGSIMVTRDVTLNTKYVNYIKELNNRGVVNSVCSNNYFDFAKPILEEMGIWNLFVMPNINYDSKGLRIKTMIEEFQLRAENVFFIDDNEFNLNEVRYFNPEINVVDGKDDKAVTELLVSTKVNNEVDSGNRLRHYRVIEEKVGSRNTYGSNEEFLIDSKIVVDIRKAMDTDVDKAHELVHRTNQLNYTKNRKDKDGILEDILNNDTYIISVYDKYGNYGDVGFVSHNKKEVQHFTFSCRILNMGVVDYVYNYFNLPTFNTVGRVAKNIGDDVPNWITNNLKHV